jgi:hypothetical protein
MAIWKSTSTEERSQIIQDSMLFRENTKGLLVPVEKKKPEPPFELWDDFMIELEKDGLWLFVRQGRVIGASPDSLTDRMAAAHGFSLLKAIEFVTTHKIHNFRLKHVKNREELC